MVFICYFIVNLFLTVNVLKYRRNNLTLLELVLYWMLSSLFIQNFSALNHLNFKLIHIPNDFEIEMTHVMNRLVLYPIFLVWFLNEYVGLKGAFKKILLVGVFVLINVGLEWLADWVKILNHVNWRVWWSFAFWFTYLLLAIAFMRIFRKMLAKE